MADRFADDAGTGFRGGTGDFGAGASSAERGSFGSEQNPSAPAGQQVLSSAPKGNPHSSAGFRRQLMRTQRQGSKLKDQMPNKSTFGGPGFKKPNYFGQGSQRHGMHIGAGAPAVTPASDTSDMSFGGGSN